MMSKEVEDKIKAIIEGVVVCQDCGGYVEDHQGVQGDCNYEAGTQIVDDTVASIMKLLSEPSFEQKVDATFGFRCKENHLINRDNFICKKCSYAMAKKSRSRKKSEAKS